LFLAVVYFNIFVEDWFRVVLEKQFSGYHAATSCGLFNAGHFGAMTAVRAVLFEFSGSNGIHRCR
jgi:hypothetical protein